MQGKLWLPEGTLSRKGKVADIVDEPLRWPVWRGGSHNRGAPHTACPLPGRHQAAQQSALSCREKPCSSGRRPLQKIDQMK